MRSSVSIRWIYLCTFYFFLYAPIAVLIVYSFNQADRSLLWHGFTFKWYRLLWRDAAIQSAMWHSILIGVLSASAATFLGILAAFSLYRYPFKGQKIIHGLMFSLIVAPDIVIGISLLILYTSFKMSLGFWTLLLGHIGFCLPFVTSMIYTRLKAFDHHLFEAAHDLGATESHMFRTIVIPMLKLPIRASWMLSFTLSFDDVVISFFLTGPDFQVLPLYIFSLVRLGVNPEINALCTIMLLITLLSSLCAWPWLRRHTQAPS